MKILIPVLLITMMLCRNQQVINGIQKKVIQKAAQQAQRNKEQQTRMRKTKNGKIVVTEPISITINDQSCMKYNQLPQLCTQMRHCGYCTKTQHCIEADPFGVGLVETCPKIYFIYDVKVWQDPLMVDYNPFSYSTVPIYSEYYDYGAPYQSNYFYPESITWYSRFKKRSNKKHLLKQQKN